MRREDGFERLVEMEGCSRVALSDYVSGFYWGFSSSCCFCLGGSRSKEFLSEGCISRCCERCGILLGLCLEFQKFLDDMGVDHGSMITNVG